MARYNGLIIPRSYNDYYRRDDPEAIREIVALAADAELNANSRNPVQNKAVAEVVPNNASTTNLLATHDDVENITKLIPDQVSEENQLADKDFVNSSISSNTAYFRGTYNSIEELEAYAGEKTLNDYAFVIDIDEVSNKSYNRYKYNGTTWEFEYTLNNSSFTAEQWAAIQSGITAELVSLIGLATGSSPIGSIIPYAGENIPAGFLLCDGRELLIEDYDKLYAIIGQLPACQSENEGYFKLPDLRGKFTQGANNNLGENIAAGLPNIKFEWSKYSENGDNHLVGVTTSQVSGEYGGAFDRQNRIRYKNTALASLGETKLDGTLQNDVYGKSDTVQPPAFTVNYIIKATSTNDSVNEIIDDSTKDVGHAWSGEKVAAEIETVDNKNNYSTEETVVGTWIDGKPIYRKVISPLPTIDFATSGWKIIGNLPNCDTFVNRFISYIDSDNRTRFEGMYLQISFLNGTLYGAGTGGMDRIILKSVIVEYTKTTD